MGRLGTQRHVWGLWEWAPRVNLVTSFQHSPEAIYCRRDTEGSGTLGDVLRRSVSVLGHLDVCAIGPTR